MLLKLCAKCGAATPNHNAICDRCAERLPAMQRERHAGYDKHRDPAKVAFYRSAAWRTLRLRKLESIGYRCEECVREWQAGLRREEDIELATEVHHIEPLEVNWARRLDITNLKGDCKAHHSAEESHHKQPCFAAKAPRWRETHPGGRAGLVFSAVTRALPGRARDKTGRKRGKNRALECVRLGHTGRERRIVTCPTHANPSTSCWRRGASI